MFTIHVESDKPCTCMDTLGSGIGLYLVRVVGSFKRVKDGGTVRDGGREVVSVSYRTEKSDIQSKQTIS